MACDRCDESREAGYAFCVSCGEPLDSCPECERARAEGAAFCPKCGRPLREPEPVEKPDALRSITSLSIPIVSILLIAEIIILLVGAASVWSWAGGATENVLILKPELAVIGTIGGLPLQIFWVVQVVIIVAAVVIIAYQTLPALKAPAEQRSEKLRGSPLYWMAMLLCVNLFLNVVLALFQLDSVGNTADIPIGMEPEALYAFANAAVWEEVITRIAFIGVPMAILAACHLRKDFLKYLLGGFGMSRTAIVLIVVSAVIFGFGHMSGWGLWKVLPTLITGLILGYLYVRFGVHVSITFHFIVDYMATMIDGSAVLIVGVLMILMIILGIPGLIDVLRRMWGSRGQLKEMPAVMPPDQESMLRRRD